MGEKALRTVSCFLAVGDEKEKERLSAVVEELGGKTVTHVVFDGGKKEHFTKATDASLPLVSPKCKDKGKLLSTDNYPPSEKEKTAPAKEKSTKEKQKEKEPEKEATDDKGKKASNKDKEKGKDKEKEKEKENEKEKDNEKEKPTEKGKSKGKKKEEKEEKGTKEDEAEEKTEKKETKGKKKADKADDDKKDAKKGKGKKSSKSDEEKEEPSKSTKRTRSKKNDEEASDGEPPKKKAKKSTSNEHDDEKSEKSTKSPSKRKRSKGEDDSEASPKKKKQKLEKKSSKIFSRRIVLSGIGDNEKEEQEKEVSKVIKSLGDCTLEKKVGPNTTHVVAYGQKRTEKVLEGISKGLYIVQPEWLTDSEKKSTWLDPAKYEAFPGGKASRIAHEKGSDKLFTGKRIYVGPATNLAREKIQSFVKSLGGQVVNTVPQADVVIAGKRASRQVITSDDQMVDTAAQVVAEEWIFEALSTGKLPDHSKFPPTVKEKPVTPLPSKKQRKKSTKAKKDDSEASEKTEGEAKTPKEKKKKEPKKKAQKTKKNAKAEETKAEEAKPESKSSEKASSSLPEEAPAPTNESKDVDATDDKEDDKPADKKVEKEEKPEKEEEANEEKDEKNDGEDEESEPLY